MPRKNKTGGKAARLKDYLPPLELRGLHQRNDCFLLCGTDHGSAVGGTADIARQCHQPVGKSFLQHFPIMHTSS